MYPWKKWLASNSPLSEISVSNRSGRRKKALAAWTPPMLQPVAMAFWSQPRYWGSSSSMT